MEKMEELNLKENIKLLGLQKAMEEVYKEDEIMWRH